MWVNSLIASAGGQIVDENGNVKVDATAKQAARDRHAAWPPRRPRRPGLDHQRRGRGPAGLRVRRARTSRSTTRSSTRAPKDAGEGLPEEDRLGALPGRRCRTSRAARRWAASTSASAPTPRTPTWPSAPRRCLAQPKNQIVAAEKGGLPPTTEALYDDQKIKKAYPFADLLRDSHRGRRAAAGQPGLQRHLAGDPEDLPPAETSIEPDEIESQAEGPPREGRPRGRSSDGAAAARPSPGHRPRHARSAGWPTCCARPR